MSCCDVLCVFCTGDPVLDGRVIRTKQQSQLPVMDITSTQVAKTDTKHTKTKMMVDF